MKLFLASYIRHPDSIRNLEGFVNGFVGKTIAYIPTAANGEDGYGSWQKGGTWELVNTLGATIKLIQLEDFRNKSVAEEIKNVDIIWVAGGMAGYLAYWLRRCELDKYLKNILDQGPIYVGSSAGAMVTGQSLQIAEFGFTDCEIGAKDIKPLKLVNFDIYPHYDEKNFDEIKKSYKGKKIYLLKNGEEIIVEDDNVVIHGEERIIDG